MFFCLQICNEILAVLNDVKEKDKRHGSASDLRHMSAQTIFSVLDHLTKWTRHRVMVLSLKAHAAVAPGNRATWNNSNGMSVYIHLFRLGRFRLLKNIISQSVKLTGAIWLIKIGSVLQDQCCLFVFSLSVLIVNHQYDLTAGNLFLSHGYDLSQTPAGIQTQAISMRSGQQMNWAITLPSDLDLS